MCVDTFSLNCVRFLLWTQIDSFVWNEIVHSISSDISRWQHQYDAYSTPIRWSRVTICYYAGSVGIACSPILSVSFKKMGCEPVLNLAATPDEAICTFIDKTIPSAFGESWYMWAVYRPARCFSRASRWCSSFNLSLGSLTWLTYAYGMLCQDHIAPEEFYLSNLYANTNLQD